MKNRFETVILGAGASGLMCAAYLDDDFVVLEGNDKAAAKMLVSGGGRCNFGNESIEASNYLGDHEFVGAVLPTFGHEETALMAKEWGVAYEVRKNRQLFCKHSARELVEPLLLRSKGKVRTNTQVKSVSYEGGFFVVMTSGGEFFAKNLVVATGGASYKSLGASEVGYEIARGFGHGVATIAPALVGFTVQPAEAWFKELSGVSTTATVSVGEKSFKENVLFAHKGISGPAILNASLYWKKGTISIDFLPDLDIDKALKSGAKQVTSVLGLPKRVTKAYLDFMGLEDKIIDKLKDEEKALIKRLKNYEFAPAGTFGYTKAEITKGGVATDEIDANTMESKLQKRLYFVGEVLDVSGELGGYNFQWAFASAVQCANAINNSK